MRDEALAAVAAARHSMNSRRAARTRRGPLAAAPRPTRDRRPSPQARAEAGKRIGATMREVGQALAARQRPWRPSRPACPGRGSRRRHAALGSPARRGQAPVTTVGERLADASSSMGYEIAEGPEHRSRVVQLRRAELPADHPARADAGHLLRGGAGWRRSGMVLRTHTSPVQIRAMLTRPLPLYVVSPGRCYRTEARRHPQPGLPPDRGPGRRRGPDHGRPARRRQAVRRRHVRRGHCAPGCGPTTSRSPSRPPDVSMECHVCRGASAGPGDALPGLPVAGLDRVAGCGMVNPRVLVACGVDPDRYSGFAFGLGIERTLMVRDGLADISGHRRGRRPVQPGIRNGGLMRVPTDTGPRRSLRGAPGRRPAQRGGPAAHEPASKSSRPSRSGTTSNGVVVARSSRIEELAGFKKPVRYCQVAVGSGQRARGRLRGGQLLGRRPVPLALPGAGCPAVSRSAPGRPTGTPPRA